MAAKKPNVLIIWGDDIGISNLSCYSDGLMGYKTPEVSFFVRFRERKRERENEEKESLGKKLTLFPPPPPTKKYTKYTKIDRLAKEGIKFTDYYGEQSCTAGRAAFLTGMSPYRSGLTKVGMPGAKIGLSGEDCTLATAMRAAGLRTGQFGKNHLGDRDEFLPTNHGFQEFFGEEMGGREKVSVLFFPVEVPTLKRKNSLNFFLSLSRLETTTTTTKTGNLYHLNAEEEPEHPGEFVQLIRRRKKRSALSFSLFLKKAT